MRPTEVELFRFCKMSLPYQLTPIVWSESKKLFEQTRNLGIEQYINNYRRSKNRDGDPFKWGDEVIYNVLFSLFLST